jgi:hypothetical protein
MPSVAKIRHGALGNILNTSSAWYPIQMTLAPQAGDFPASGPSPMMTVFSAFEEGPGDHDAVDTRREVEVKVVPGELAGSIPFDRG